MMKLQDRVRLVVSLLDEYVPDPPIPLLHRDPYTLLVAVVLSARNQDKRVNQITPSLFSKASTPQEMVNLSVPEIETHLQSCGLFRVKARYIWHLSKMLLEKYQGKVPNSIEELQTLPGVGRKTASVVISQAFSIPAFPIDTHIFRSARRWGLTRETTSIKVEKSLKKLFPSSKWLKIHLQIIAFARKYCPARGHSLDCPICFALETFDRLSTKKS